MNDELKKLPEPVIYRKAMQPHTGNTQFFIRLNEKQQGTIDPHIETFS